MKYDLKKRWTIVVLIWSGAFILTCWNVNRIDAIIQSGKTYEELRLDEQFCKYSARNISETLKKSESLYQPVESSNMGLLCIQAQLETLASKYAFGEVRVKAGTGAAVGQSIPIDLHFTGSFEKAVKYLGILQENYPYMPVTKVKITVDQPGKPVSFNVFLKYRYRISAPGQIT